MSKWVFIDTMQSLSGVWQTVCRRLCLKRQVIDLLAEGYTSEQLDAEPAVKVEDW